MKLTCSIFLGLCIGMSGMATLPALAAGISNDCGDMAKAVPNKIGDLPLVKKICTTISAAGAKSIGTYPGRYIEATYEGKSPKQSIKITLKDQRNDPDQVLKGNPQLVEQVKSAEKTLAAEAAQGNQQFVDGYKYQRAHTRAAPLANPDEAVLNWHENPTTPVAEVRGAVYGTVNVMIDMSATNIDTALSTLNQINSAVNYSAMR